MFVTQKQLRGRKPLGLTLMSDLHIGAKNVDYKTMKADLDAARENGDRILINGDVMDLILPMDLKRFRMEALDSAVKRQHAVLNAEVEYAYEKLSPYADLIDMIGCGNHELAVEKHHSYDPIRALVYELNKLPGADVHYGGICGWVDYKVMDTRKNAPRDERSGTRWRYTIYYHHGAGGVAMVTKGMIQGNRMATWIEADLMWVGHSHNRIIDKTGVRVSLSAQGNEVMRPKDFVITGGYLTRPEPDTHAGFMAGKPKSASYAEEKNYPPQQPGCARVVVEFENGAKIGRVRIAA